jgi:polyvinyl alcohol dehydrogenase (cytochrome)
VGWRKSILLAGQKSGAMFGLDAGRAGHVVWQSGEQKDSVSDGITYGYAADANTVYFARIGESGLSAVEIKTGKESWRVPAPSTARCSWGTDMCNASMAGAVTLMPGAVFVGSNDGHLRAYASKTGSLLWDFDTAAQSYGAVNGVIARGGAVGGSSQIIANGMLYVNSGYSFARAGNALLAMSVDGK